MRFRIERVAAAAALAVSLVALTPGAANAAVLTASSIDFPADLQVGDTDVPASITIERNNTGAEENLANTICNPAANPAQAPCAGNEGIVLVPYCLQISGGVCGETDRGAIDVSSASVQPAGEDDACNGKYDIREIPAPVGDPPTGKYLIKIPAASSIVLDDDEETCKIDFTITVNRMPEDANPALPGVQISQLLTHRQFSGAASSDGVASSTTTVTKAGPPRVLGDASSNTTLGNLIYDTAKVRDLANPSGPATLTYRLYPPEDFACAGVPVFTDVRPVNAVGARADSVSSLFQPAATGTYRWTVTYDGDDNNLPSGPTACGNVLETVVIAPGPSRPEVAPPTPAGKGPTGRRARAIKGCRKGKSKPRVKKCLKRARKLPV